MSSGQPIAARSGRRARPARARPRGCCRGSPRAGCGGSRAVPGPTAATPSTSSAPMVSATCASFGPYSDQSTWIDVDVVDEQPRQRDLLHVVVAGRSAWRRTSSRGSGANARKPPTAPGARGRARRRPSGRDRPPALHGQSQDVQPGVTRLQRRPRGIVRRRRAAASAIAVAGRRPRSASASRRARRRRAPTSRPARTPVTGTAPASARAARTAATASSSDARRADDRGSRRRRRGRQAPPARASTCISNTRTNVVRAPCSRRRSRRPCTPTAIRSGLGRACLARRYARSAQPRSCLPSLAGSAPRSPPPSAAAVRRRRDPRSARCA